MSNPNNVQPEHFRLTLTSRLPPSPCSQVYPRAKEEVLKLARIPAKGRAETKRLLRGAAVDELLAGREADVAWFTEFVLEEGTQKGIKAYLDSLKKK